MRNLQSRKFEFSSGFVKKLIELAEGKISSEMFESVLERLKEESVKYFFNSSSEANLLRIISSVYDRAFLFGELLRYPHHAEILIAVSASSNYLTDIIVRNPEYLYQIFDQDYLSNKPQSYDYMIELQGPDKFKSLGAKLNFLRQFKKRNILRIGTADILGIYDLAAVTEQLSLLANSIIEKLFDLCFDEICAKYNLSGLKKNFSLCSLGKLGGSELNYSSDVDLILFYDDDLPLPAVNKEYREILTETALLFIKASTEITDHGYIYRIDFRLRPDGKNSALCNSLYNYSRYYEMRGEDWERQMLIKLNFLSGDKAIFEKFSKFIQPFIYPATFSDSVKERIREMKLNIERQHDEIDNVKTFKGGIRDIEFSVQALQLLNGGRNKNLRSGNTLVSIAALAEAALLKPDEKETLSSAYIFYRKIEHFLQLMDDRQTHSIPENRELQNKLSIFLQLNSAEEFRKELKSFRNDVRRIYNEILSSEEANQERIFNKIEFNNRARALSNISYLRTGKGIVGRKEFDTRTIELFASVEPSLFKYLKKAADPDKILENFVKIMRGTKFPSIWFGEIANERSLKNFLSLCHYCQKGVDLISNGGEAEELYLSHKVFQKQFETEELSSMDSIILSSAVQFSLGLISAEQVSNILTSTIKQKIASVFQKHNFTSKYFVAGLGSFGSDNMSFSSDVDLIIVAEEVESNPQIQKEFQYLLLQIGEMIKPFSADFKLRPEGNKSPLVSGIHNYNEYLDKRARVWEFQSLLKLKFVCGDENLFENFKGMIFKRFDSFDSAEIRIKILNMYSEILKQQIRTSGFNIKKEKGGLLTIDFLLQAVAMFDPRFYRECFGKSIQGIIKILKDKIDSEDLKTLKHNFSFLKETALAIQNIAGSANSIIPASTGNKLVLSHFLRFKNIEAFDEQLKEIIKQNNSLFEKYAAG